MSTDTQDSREVVEIVAHAVCPFTDALDGACMRCKLDERGPNGGVRGCVYVNAAAARAILNAIEASGWKIVPGWQPMETAPKDGGQFLMLGDPTRYGRPIWIDRWWGVNYDGSEVVVPRWEHAGHHNPPASLIGWMPLPAAPKEGQ